MPNDDDPDAAVRESFHKFFESWLVEQNQHLQELTSVSKQYENDVGSSTTNGEEQAQVLHPLVERVVQHYEHYYRAKSRWVKLDVLAMLSPTWRSSLEDAFLWIGGWRPSMSFHLLYSKSGLQLEAKLHDVIRGLTTGDLADLSPTQLTRVDELHRVTLREEKELTEKMAKAQETVVDTPTVELSHVITALMSQNPTQGEGNVSGIMENEVQSTIESKEEKLEEIFHKADDLRLRTLKAIVDILSPIQAVHFLIAAAELHLRLHDWGKMRDARRYQHHGTGTGTDPQ
ncbi:transcription factor TGA6-like [Melia azedarach]|uniref:Transcription factor TGA6-like n=1 Tax=Melia azedarach TaxID=155640 RepID=A0ACC1XUR2_MELAZ|nr:transcription factor TGA6-like [Melia azedarach]